MVIECYAYSFTDFLYPFGLYHGKGSHHYLEDQVGSVKGSVRLYQASGPEVEQTELNQFPSNEPLDVLVRVYVVEVS